MTNSDYDYMRGYKAGYKAGALAERARELTEEEADIMWTEAHRVNNESYTDLDDILRAAYAALMAHRRTK